MHKNLISSPVAHHRLKELDGWRGLAIILVLLAHFTHPPFINAGALGVELFFVLSGRLMAEILFVNKSPLPSFIRRRISRIYPVLLFTVVTLGIAFSSPSNPLHIDLPTALSAATLTFNYYSLFQPISHVLDHIWSLCVEEHSYIFLAVLAFICRRYNLTVLPILFIAAGLFMLNGLYQSWDGASSVYWRSDVHAASILLSAAVYMLAQSPQCKRLLSGFTAPIFTCLGIILFSTKMPEFIQFTLGTACLAIAVNGITEMPSSLRKLLAFRPLAYVGVVSYSLYLWQQPFYKLAQNTSTLIHLLLLFAALATGIGSYYLLETPSRRWLNAYWAKRGY